MGNQGSSPHEPLGRAHLPHTNDFKMKSSVRSSLRRAVRGGAGGGALSPTTRGGMERLRRSFRESFRRRKGNGGSDAPESTRPHQWAADEAAVRAGACTFPVKYLGCVEVFESRGMQVCEEALKVLRNSRRRPTRAVLHVSGDGLRVVEEETKGLIVDQTIEKVSFCAPDRNHERGFSYICRDGTTRRWMCHGFVASRDSGERLSHAVGCAFAACLERKQRRDKECAVSMSIDAASHAFTRQGSFRRTGVFERRASEAVSCAVPTVAPAAPAAAAASVAAPVAAPVAAVAPVAADAGVAEEALRPAPHNPFAVQRPHAAAHLLERQGSFRTLAHLNNNSPFKRQMSLRITDLPSNVERQRAGLGSPPAAPAIPVAPVAPAIPVAPVAPVPAADLVAAMCQQLSQGLRALTEEPVPLAPLPAVPALPHPDAWLGRVAGETPRAPPLAHVARAKSFAGGPAVVSNTNPFLPRPAPAPL